MRVDAELSGSGGATPTRRRRPQGRQRDGGRAVAPPSGTGKTRRQSPASRLVQKHGGDQPATGIARLLRRYREEVQSALTREFGYRNVMEAPVVRKVTLNMGLGEALANPRVLETAPEQLGIIAGQRPVITKARKAISTFKVREGMAIGAAVTLRGHRMWQFLDRLINVALPRIRDFRGTPRAAFDGNGNYTMGIREQIIFPEIDYNQVDRIRGLQVTITTSSQSDREAFRLLELLGMPFAREPRLDP